MTAKTRTACRILLFSIIMLSFISVQAQTASTLQLPTLPAEITNKPFTVDEAVAFALQHNPSIKLAGEEVAVAQYQLNSARAGVRPSVGLGVDSTYYPGLTPLTFQNIPISFTFSSTAEAVINQPLFPFSRLKAPVQSARASVGISQETLARTRQQVEFQTRQAFDQLLIAKNMLQVSDYAVQVAQGQLKLAQDTVNAGTAPLLDKMQAQSTLENANVSQEAADNNVQISRATLATQLGLSAGTSIDIVSPTTVPVAPQDVDTLVKSALSARPDLAQMLFRRRQLKAAISLTSVESLPTVNLQASYAQAITGSSALETMGASIAVNIAFTAFDWGKAHADVKALKTQLAEVDSTEQQLALSTTLDVRSAWLNLRNATAQLGSAEKQFDAANEALRISEVRYRAGIGIYLELQQAYLAATQALTSFSQATYQAQSAAAQLEFAVGTPLQLATAPIPQLSLIVPSPLPIPTTK